MGLFTGFSVISGVEILYWLFFIILCKKKSHVDPEKSEDLCDDFKVKESENTKQLEEKVMKQEEETEKQREKIMQQEEEMKKQKEKFEDLEKKVELLQMIQKQSEFGDSHAGSFFDAIFKTSKERMEDDNQEETV